MRRVLKVLCIIWFLSVLVMTFLAYMVSRFDSAGEHLDGLGRHLNPAPPFIRIFFGTNDEWAGWGWFFGDMILFWGSVGLIIWVFKSDNSD